MREFHAKVREIFPFFASAWPVCSGKCHVIGYAEPPLAHEFDQTIMKLRFSNRQNQALTLTEAVMVIAALAVLAALILPALAAAKHGAKRINCVSNLKQIGIAYRLWEGDHNDKYPMAVSVTNGGTMGLADGRNAWINYFVMSNELSTPKILHCPTDANRFAATNFSAGFNNQNISYFVGLDVTNNTNPQMFLSGDDNFAINGMEVKSGVLELLTNTPVMWTKARHKFVGNIGMADGCVQQVSTDFLQKALQQTGAATNRLVLP
jgi:competence protein ComGC